MEWRNTDERYGMLSAGLHWLMLLLIVAVYACIDLREMYPKGSDLREGLKIWHFMLGISVFLLVWIRILAHFVWPVPGTVSAPPGWQEHLGTLMHVALYGLMIALPLLGWLTLGAEGKEIPFFGLQLPALIAEDKNLAGLFKEIHEIGGTAGYFLIGMHALAALFHHYFLRDKTLLRMLPTRT